jgi:hypothetical protein
MRVKKSMETMKQVFKDKESAEVYAKTVGMDQANTKMAVVAATEGFQAAANKMMSECNGDYAAMRARYG